MIKLNSDLLALVKKGFVPMPGGMAEPVAGAGMMTAAHIPVSPPGGGGMPPPGGDPAMMGGGMPPPGGDPAMMGGMPPPGGDPAMMGGMPPPGGDPAMGGMPPPGGDPAMGGDPAAAAPGQIVMSPEEFARVLQVVASSGSSGGDDPAAAGGDPAAGAKPKKLSTDAKLDLMAQALGVQFPGADAGAAPAGGVA
jgi:hypothetical protein